MPGLASAAFSAQGRLQVLAVDHTGPSAEIDRTYSTGVFNEDSAAVSAPLDNSASGWYRVSIPGAEMAAGAQVDGGEPSGTGRHSGANTYIQLDLNDQLQCTIPAGSYPDGVYVRTMAVLSGHIHAGGGDGLIPPPTADLVVTISMGDATVVKSYPQVTPDNSPLEVSSQTLLEHQIVPPGSVYQAPVLNSFTVNGALVFNVSTPSQEEAWGGAGGNPRLFLEPMMLSGPGVTCTSDSGVFLSDPARLPGLGRWAVALTAAGLLALATSMLRRRAVA
jgi:hypothetical protein